MATNKALSGLALERMNNLFEEWHQRGGVRPGIHASSIIAPDDTFCYRELVLAKFYLPLLGEQTTWTLRIFLNGWHVHIKWQKLYQDAGIAEEVEKTHYDARWGLSFTPDAIIRLLSKRTIVEIKSMNMKQFADLLEPPDNAVRQANLYMYLLDIPQALILVENKNDQNLKTWVIDYDETVVQPFIRRLNTLNKLWEAHADPEDGRLPKRICKTEKDVRARKCPLREVCFASPQNRQKYLFTKEVPDGKSTAAAAH